MCTFYSLKVCSVGKVILKALMNLISQLGPNILIVIALIFYCKHHGLKSYLEINLSQVFSIFMDKIHCKSEYVSLGTCKIIILYIVQNEFNLWLQHFQTRTEC